MPAKILRYGVPRLPSASEIDRVISCPASTQGPDIYEETSVAAHRGNVVHDFLRRVLALKGEQPESVLEELRVFYGANDPGVSLSEQLDLAQLPRGGDLEVAVAWDPEKNTARILGRNIERAYEEHGADRSVELVGSADLVGLLEDGTLLILDWKSGQKTSAAASWQLKILAVMLAVIYGATRVRAGLAFLRPDRVFWDMVEYDELALASIRARLRLMLKQIAFPSTTVHEGSHCHFCPRWKACPAKVALIREIPRAVAAIDTMQPIGAGADAPVELERARDAFLLLERLEVGAKRLRAEIEKYAAHHPLDLGDGRWLREAPGRSEDTVVDGFRAVDLVAAELDREAAAEATCTTKGALEAAAGSYAKRNKLPIGKAKKALIDVLREKGLIVKLPGTVKVRITDTAPNLDTPALAPGSETA